MKDYSQSGEQAVILKYFHNKIGSFLDIGANDGITFSNTYALALKGWCGSVIEPSPKAYARLKALYENTDRVQAINVAIGKEDGVITLKESGSILGNGDVALVSSFDEKEVERFKKITSWEDVNVYCISWKTLTSRISLTYEFISIDIEGSELDVLPYMDFDAMDTQMLCIEWNSKPELKKEYDKYMKGFKVIYTSAENIIYAR